MGIADPAGVLDEVASGFAGVVFKKSFSADEA